MMGGGRGRVIASTGFGGVFGLLGGRAVERLGLAESVEALRAELARAATAGAGAGFQFPVTGVQLEFHVGVTKAGEGSAGVRFWVVELGGSGSYAQEEIQTVTVTLGAPVDDNGDPVKIYHGSAGKP
jgi:Trypsin-co-occurring domain 2